MTIIKKIIGTVYVFYKVFVDQISRSSFKIIPSFLTDKFDNCWVNFGSEFGL